MGRIHIYLIKFEASTETANMVGHTKGGLAYPLIDRMAPTVRKQRVMDAGAQLAFAFYCNTLNGAPYIQRRFSHLN